MEPVPPRRGPVQARAKERIERILDAAELIFAEVGFQAATTNQIALRAGTSIGSIYEFLGSKHAIAKALAERYVTEFNDLAQKAAADANDGDAVLLSLVDVVAGFYERHAGLAALFEGSRGSEDLQAAHDALHASLIAPVEQMIVARRRSADPARCRVVAEMCAHIAWPAVGEAARRPQEDRSAALAELKLVLASYLALAVPR